MTLQTADPEEIISLNFKDERSYALVLQFYMFLICTYSFFFSKLISRRKFQIVMGRTFLASRECLVLFVAKACSRRS